MRSARPDDAVLIGVGAVSALGHSLDASFEALAAGTTAVTPSEDPGLPARAVIARPLLRRKVPPEMEPQIKFLNGAGMLAADATAEAIAAAGLLAHGVDPERRGLFLSQVDSEAWDCHEFRPAFVAATDSFTAPLESEALSRAAVRRVKPFFMLESLKNNAFSFLATIYELRGTNVSVAGYAGATAIALDTAVRGLARGSLDAAVVVGAARPTGPVALAEMAGMKIPQPPGDAAAALVLERRVDAAQHGARPAAAVVGFGAATHTPKAHDWRPSVPALLDAARIALADADAGPGEIAAVVAPGLGEAGLEDALAQLPALAGVPHVTWKQATGHCALASETLEWALAARALDTGCVPGLPAVSAPQALLILGAGLLGQASAVVLARA